MITIEAGGWSPAAETLLRLLPPVLRARDFYLYLEDGRRLTDLWQNGGRAILGHKPPGVLRDLKNAAERGLFSPLPHPAEKRLVKALSLILPGRAFRLYNSEDPLRRALEKVPSGENQAALWRPFIPADAAGSPADAALLIPILPWPLAPLVLAADQKLEAFFPPGNLISPALLAAAARAVYDLIAAGKERGGPLFRRINKALAAPGCKWRRRGIYLTYGANVDSWTVIWKRFLEGGFLLPPSPQDPLILPGAMSPGEEAKLAELLEE
jgi:hypothetical protein